MASQEHLDILRQGTAIWNKWRQEHPGIVPDLDDASLNGENLAGIDLSDALMKNTHCRGTQLQNASLSHALLEDADFSKADLNNADLDLANMKRAILKEANLKGAHLKGAHLEDAILDKAVLEGAFLDRAHLQKASFKLAHLEGASLEMAQLEGANLREAFCSNTTRLHDVTLSTPESGSVFLADISWGDTNLAVARWSSVQTLGDEQIARESKGYNQAKKYIATRVDEYRTAVRANRQLVGVLREQGLNEEADHFAYQAQELQRIVWKLQGEPVRYIFSGFLNLLAGYGYKPERSLYAYLLTIAGFAALYYLLAQHEHVVLSFGAALIYSLSAFHGRGFFPGPTVAHLDDPLIVWSAAEGIAGLLIEISFIATFTQRFFGK